MTSGSSICARPPKSVARNLVPVFVRHSLRPPVPLCRSLQSVARNRPTRAARAFRHRAPNPFAGGIPSAWVIFVQIPVLACPRRSSSIPLCKSGKGCGAKHTVNPPGYIRRLAVPCPACSRRFRPGWQGQCGSSHAPLYVPYAAEGPSARKIWRPSAPRRAESPLVISCRTPGLHDEIECARVISTECDPGPKRMDNLQ